MIKNLTNSISNSSLGPIVKPLVSSSHDIMGNSLGGAQQAAVETLSSTDLTAIGLVFLLKVGGLTSSSSFSLGGQNYTINNISINWANTSGGEGDFTYVTLTAPNDSGGANIRTVLVDTILNETVGLRISGSGGTEDFYPEVIGSGTDFKWKNSGSGLDSVLLRVNAGTEMVPFNDSGVTMSLSMGNSRTDEITISILT